MTVSLIGVWKVWRRNGIVETHAEALRVGELDVLRDATGQIGVSSVNSRVEHCHRHSSTAFRQTSVRLNQIVIAPRAFDTGQIARRRLKVPLKCSVAIDGSHGRQARNRLELRFGRSYRDHRQHSITCASQNTKALEVTDVGIGRGLIIDDDGVYVAVISNPIEQHSEFGIEALQTYFVRCVIQCGHDCADSCLNKAIGPTNRDPVSPGSCNAINSAYRQRVWSNREDNSIRARGRNSIGSVDGKRVIGSARGDTIGVINEACVGATRGDAICTGSNDVVCAAGRDACRISNYY